MAGDILIVDCVATNRIVLKVKLLAAQYRVRPCASAQAARDEIAASIPDLIILDTGADTHNILDLCRELKANDRTSLIPIIATGGFPTPRDRVAALKSGADEVLSKPFNDQILQARIRSLLRSRDAQQELRMRDGTKAALGFAEAESTFEVPSHVVLSASAGIPMTLFEEMLARLPQVKISHTPVEHLVSGRGHSDTSDLFVIDFRHGLEDETMLFRLLSELRSRSQTRLASILVLLPQSARQAAAMALDLGANDVVCARVDPDEIRHRCSVLLQNKHESDALRRTVETGLEAAITDPLTGLFNRRYALPHLKRLSRESRSSGRQFAIMVLDLDHFKSINDTYGHPVGDEVLKQVATRLRDNLRAVDLLARVGGEEFLVAIPNSDVTHARTAAERLCKLIGDTPFYVGPEREELPVTVSVGVSLSDGLDACGMTGALDDLVSAADVALYAAKNGGRNKVSLSAA